MSKHRRHWSESDKKAILQHYQEHGASSAARQFEVSTSMIYRWAADPSPAAVKEVETAISSKEYHRLLRENQTLKELVAEKELEIRIKSDRRSGCSIKKNFPSQQERLIIAQEFMGADFPKNKVLALCSIARSSYYYRPSEGKQGRKPYAKVTDEAGQLIDNEIIVKYIHALFNHPFVDYGYYKTYIYLRRKKQVTISKHLVYRLMKSHRLLRNQYVNSSKKAKRNWVKDLLPQVETAFCYLEFDRGGGPHQICMGCRTTQEYAGFDRFRRLFPLEY